jgi:hypothetical protein
MLHNMDEIRDTARRTYVEKEDELIAFHDTLNQTRMFTP